MHISEDPTHQEKERKKRKRNKLDATHQAKEDRELDPQVQELSLSVNIFVIGQFDCNLIVKTDQFGRWV